MSIQKLKNLLHFINALIAAVYYGFPGKSIKVIGVTGTDGKTTTSHLIHHILVSSGLPASLVSSVYAEIGGKKYDTGFHVTTPDPWMLQKFLRQAILHGDQYMILEVTSHGLDQNRVGHIDFLIGLITNITHEHLDYHKTYEQYLYAKSKLLTMSKTAIINRDDESYSKLLQIIENSPVKKIVSYGIKNEASFSPRKFIFTSPLPGEYNRYNCLAAISVAKEIGLADRNILKALKTFVGVKGRFEKISNKFGLTIIIDFAHTPNAIEKVLSTIHPTLKGKLIHVFGSAARRDVTKRPIMGSKSAEFADVIILTEEDYRDEPVEKIMNEIAQGALKCGAKEIKTSEYNYKKKYTYPLLFKIANREDAIHFALRVAQKNDTVILTGKAHEKSLCRGSIEYPWNEHEAVYKALASRKV